MDETYLLRAARYVELNPVRAGICNEPEHYRWSSIHAHLKKTTDDRLTKPEPLLALAPDWMAFLATGLDEEERTQLRSHENTGRPLGSDDFIEALEQQTGRPLKKKKPGPKQLT